MADQYFDICTQQFSNPSLTYCAMLSSEDFEAYFQILQQKQGNTLWDCGLKSEGEAAAADSPL